ncbi:MAG: PAS domain S-box protein [Chloroflexi bacterium]|nr:MAG: PAS domain S-box protein [Chloroflexota bacterium]
MDTAQFSFVYSPLFCLMTLLLGLLLATLIFLARRLNAEITARKQAEATAHHLEQHMQASSAGLNATNQQLRTEIENQQAAEQALLKQQTRFARAEAVAHIGSWEIDIATGKSIWSDEFYRIFGLEPGQIVPSTDTGMQYIHPDDRERTVAALQQALEGRPYRVQKRIVRPDGTVRHVLAEGELITDDSGTPKTLAGSLLDITNRVLAEQELRRQNELLQTIFDEIPVMIDMYDSDERLQFANHEWERVFGWTLAEAKGQKMLDHLYPDPAKRAVALANIRTDHSGWQEFEQLTRDSRRVYTRWTNIQLSDGSSVGFGQDITAAKDAERKLHASLAEKEILLKEIHHRVKNNMQIISSMLDLQARRVDDHPTISILHDTETRVRAMALVHENLYRSDDFSRINMEKHIRGLTRHLFHTYKKPEQAIGLNINVSPDIQLTLESAIPCGLLINELVSNALKYAFPDSRREDSRILVSLYSEGPGTLALQVHDNGIGFPPEFNVETADSLGLKLVNALTHQLDGRLEILPGPGAGFKITFPQ